MKPLQSVAMGLLVVGLTARFGEYDGLPDPLGWVLVLVGVARFPADLERRTVLLGLAALAGLVAVPLWVPAVAEALEDVDASLAWALTLPQLGFVGLLCHVLAARATAAADLPAARRLRLAVTLTAVVAALPVLVLGAGVEALATAAAALAVLTLLFVIWQLFACSGRAWAGAPSTAGRSGQSPAADLSGP
ncbi:hypothetical protein GGQ22_14630 [Nocardioides sp. zg-579]|uniref:Low temperature requirement protein A n=1 Tax=Nocardioides marmotae TaxID=2663857 RepID=A0A6I3JDV0_9ACTN|nr:hypothetical protein [Nocardioides marmotae]MCR6032661.1 hypothetical protein [Gordonia jinghuaiqii]MTB96310.1 hypothetical protein [Nocardioides marmotae]QKE03202.1 hypothetical protein HPC71_20670 [Nocardioides marmotae]